MMPKTTKTTATASKLASSIDLFSGKNIPSASKAKVRDEVGELLKDQILIAVGNQSSPIVGEKWPSLNPAYKKHKLANNLPGKANMEFTGSMLDSLSVKDTAQGIEIGVFGKDAGKADGHNNFSGSSDLPQRRFLPDEGQKFKSNINSRIDEIISDVIVDDAKIKRSDLKEVTTKSGLFDILGATFVGLTRSEVKESVLRSERLVQILSSLDLLRFLS